MAENEPLDALLKSVVDTDGKVRRRVERKLAAVLAIDIAGYSLLMGRDDEGTHRRVGKALRRVHSRVRRANGQIFSFSGDGLMAAFPSAIVALQCAAHIQADSRKQNADVDPLLRVGFRVGINVGEIVFQGRRLGGDVVNIAARLQEISKVHGICATAAVYEQCGSSSAFSFEYIGQQRLKNIRQLVAVYRVLHLNATPILDPMALQILSDWRPRVAILPFQNMSARADESYFSDGVVEDIIVSLTGLRELVVISRSSSMAFAEANTDPREIGRSLSVGYIVTGTLRRASRTLRLAVELIEIDTGSTLWARRFDTPIEGLFEVQDQIVRSIVSAVAPYIREGELQRALRKHPGNMTAYDLTLQALHLMEQWHPSVFEQARPLLARSMQLDPKFAMPVAWNAWWHIRWVGHKWSTQPEEDIDHAAFLAKLAVKLDPHDPLALAMQGHLHSFIFHDHDVGLSFHERAIAAGPNHSIAAIMYAVSLAYVGRGEEAVKLAEHGLQLSPLDRRLFLFYTVLAWAHYSDGNYDIALRDGLNFRQMRRQRSRLI